MESFEKNFGLWVVKRRWPILLAALFLVLIFAKGMPYLTFNNDNRVFFSADNPQLKALEELENTYTKSQNVLFMVVPKNGNVFTGQTLSAVEELTELGWQTPFSNRVDSLTNFQHAYAEEDDLIVENLVKDIPSLSNDDLQRIRKIALSEPALVNRIVSSEGHVTAINVNILLPGKSIEEVPEIAAYARKVAGDITAKYHEIEIRVIGGIMFDNAFGEATQKDMSTLIPAMFITLLLITGFALRSVIATISTLIIILISMVSALGISGWTGMELNIASANAPTIILTLAVADSVHILVTIFNQMRLGMAKNDAIAESIRVNLQPVFLTSLTTIIGFLTMNFSDAPPFRDLGNIVSIGIAAAFLHSAFTLPALISVLPLRVLPEPEEKTNSGHMGRLAEFVINNRNSIFWATGIAMLALISGIWRIELNDNFLKYFDKSFDIRVNGDFAQEHLTGLDIIEYSIDSGEEGGINNPDYLTKLEEFANWYREQPKVVHVNVITDTLKRLNKNMHGDDESYYAIPNERELAAQYLLLYEMSLPFGLDLNNMINVDKSATRMIVTLRNTTTREQMATEAKAQTWLAENAPKEMRAVGSGLSIVWAHISQRNIDSMLGASFGALIVISLILFIALRSFKLGLISFIPNLAPAFMAFGIWGYFAGQVGLAVAVLGAMTLGIVVDDTVHFLSKYRRARREHKHSAPDAVRYSFVHVGKALWVTTLALVAGFSILAFSGYKGNSDMGQIAAITISLALALDFLFLPSLLLKFDND